MRRRSTAQEFEITPFDTARMCILLATAGSPSARRATIFAAELAAAEGANLIVVHVVPTVEFRFARFGPLEPLPRHLDDPWGDRVLLEARRLAWDRGAPARLLLLAGDPREAIVRVARRVGADLVVLGWHPHRRLSRGVTWWVETHAPCPVFAVPMPDAARMRRRRRPAAMLSRPAAP